MEDDNKIELPSKKKISPNNTSIPSVHNFNSFSRKTNQVNGNINYHKQMGVINPNNYMGEDETNEDIQENEVNQENKLAGNLKEQVKETVETKAKAEVKKKVAKKVIIPMLPYIIAGFALIFFIAIIVNVVGPVIGGILDLTSGGSSNTTSNSSYNGSNNYTPSGNMGKPVDIDISSLIPERKKMITAAYSAIGAPYIWGRRAKEPTIEEVRKGVDCSGFVSWLLWVGFNDSKTYTTLTMYENIGKNFVQINYSDLKPGDFGLNRANGQGHTAMYVGNGKWIHAKGEKWGIVEGNIPSGFKYYLRYYKIPEGY